ncbi:hypothetical protein AYL99_11939 [Fonsecaea erecta]|uniref:Uncharacterized protein n=1 Tax=Fonsecaea erecta TaxID=1367422 RepID=A0A178Z2H0_9EURO|nr:hypothetical protein AYL99_11939 [Fonsecaea erecta]OAP53917.1 hypothetical protein AYL99_11939 [Fonsecaea erecta]
MALEGALGVVLKAILGVVLGIAYREQGTAPSPATKAMSSVDRDECLPTGACHADFDSESVMPQFHLFFVTPAGFSEQRRD